MGGPRKGGANLPFEKEQLRMLPKTLFDEAAPGAGR
jgi:hypothetical protein